MTTPEAVATVTTPGGKELVYRTWLSARQRNQIRGASVSTIELGEENKLMMGDPITATELKAISVIVVSYDGKTKADEFITTLLDGEPAEYDYVATLAQGVGKKTFQTAK